MKSTGWHHGHGRAGAGTSAHDQMGTSSTGKLGYINANSVLDAVWFLICVCFHQAPSIYPPSFLAADTHSCQHTSPEFRVMGAPSPAEEAGKSSTLPRIRRPSCLLSSCLAPWPGQQRYICLGGCRYAAEQPLPSNVGWHKAPAYENISHFR